MTTLADCARCKGTGLIDVEDIVIACVDCAGTGKAEVAPIVPDVRCAQDWRKACAIDGYCDQCPLAPSSSDQE